MANAKVIIKGAKFKRQLESDDAGGFTIELPVGTYQIVVQATGFRRFESTFLKVKPEVTEMVNIHLELQPAIDTIPILNN